MQATNTTNFQKQLADVVRSAMSRQSAIQQLLVFGCLYAAENDGNFLYVSKLVRGMTGVKGFRNGLLIQYIKATCAVEYVKDKAGDMIFRALKGDKAEGRSLVNMTMLASPWYDFEKTKKDEKAQKTVDQLVSYLEKWQKADAESITPEARELCTCLLQSAASYKTRLLIAELTKVEEEVAAA